MIATITLLSCCIAGLLTAMVHYRSKYWNYFDISEKAEKDLEETEFKTAKFVKSMEKKLTLKGSALETSLKKKYKNLLSKKIKVLEKESQEKYDLLAKNLEQDYNNACEEVKNELFAELEKVDIAMKNHAESLAMKNILTFSCSCSRDLIPVAIDFSKENTFICSKCGSKYKIAINANPILVGRAVSDEKFADLIEKRLHENKE